MKIISGGWRGRQLRTTTGPGYRPAMGKVRGALFSMLEARGVLWEETRVLDLFAGSGSLGFEALSRGAREACFVESSPQAAALIRKNAELLGAAPERFRVLAEDAGKALRGSPLAPYDIVFIDPPYGKNLLASTVKALLKNGWLAPGGILNAEVEGGLKYDPREEAEELSLLADRSYGQTRVILWTRAI